MVAHSGFTPARIEEIRIQLLDPFDPAEIKWRVTATSSQQGRNGPVKRGQLVAYADQRAYTDRLNEIFGEWGWTRTYNVQVAQNFERTLNKGANGQKQSVICAKVVVVSTVSVSGLGSHTGVGEEWADDENSATRAEAQAFKRACACFGLGRYLYDLDKIWEDLDQYNRPVRNPNLPDWALPAHARRQTQPQSRPHSPGPAQPRQGLVQQETLAKVKQLCETVGFGLSKFTLQKYGGVTDASKIGFAKLTMVFEKLTDLANGIERLRTASAKLPDGRYAAICRELNFASDSLDDIPDRDGLCALLKRVEAEVGDGNDRCHPAPGARLDRGTARKAASSGPEGCGRWTHRLARKVRRRDRTGDRRQGDARAIEEPDRMRMLPFSKQRSANWPLVE